jgi:hypothetical protein
MSLSTHSSHVYTTPPPPMPCGAFGSKDLEKKKKKKKKFFAQSVRSGCNSHLKKTHRLFYTSILSYRMQKKTKKSEKEKKKNSVPPFNFGATFQFVTHVQSEIL